jgi:hypothetical protein
MKIRRQLIVGAVGLIAVCGVYLHHARQTPTGAEAPDAFAVPLIEAITQGANPGTTGTPLLMLVNVCPRWPFCHDEKTLLYTHHGGKVLFYWYRKDKPCTLTYNPTGECANAESKGFEILARLIETGPDLKVVDGRLYWKGVFVYAFSLEGLKISSFAFTGRLFYQTSPNSRQYFSQPVEIKKKSLTTTGPPREEDSIIPGASTTARDIPVIAIFSAALVAGVLLLPSLKEKLGPRLSALHPMTHSAPPSLARESSVSGSVAKDSDSATVLTRTSSSASLVAREAADDTAGLAQSLVAKDFGISWTTTTVPSEHTGSVSHTGSLLSASVLSNLAADMSESPPVGMLGGFSPPSSFSKLASYFNGGEVCADSGNVKAPLTPLDGLCPLPDAGAVSIRVNAPARKPPEYTPYESPESLPRSSRSSPHRLRTDTPPFVVPSPALRLAGTESPVYTPRVGNVKLPRSGNSSPWSSARAV